MRQSQRTVSDVQGRPSDQPCLPCAPDVLKDSHSPLLTSNLCIIGMAATALDLQKCLRGAPRSGWQFAHPRPLSLLQRGLAPRSKGKARAVKVD